MIQGGKGQGISMISSRRLGILPLITLNIRVSFKFEVTKKSGDGGIDIKANLEHHFSPEIEFIFQVKRWRHSVGRPDIANLRGSIGYNNFGVMISTSHFTKSAITEANADEKKPINLVGIDLLHTIIKTTDFKLAI